MAIDKGDQTWYNKTMEVKITVRKNGEIHVKGDAIIIGDLHIPLQDDKILKMVMDEAKARGIKLLIINGDFLNADSFSRFDKKQRGAEWEKEKKVARRVMKKLMEVFEVIVWGCGNHDAHPARKASYILSQDDIARIVIDNYPNSKVFVTQRDYIIYNDSWRICHPDTYEKKPCGLAKKIGMKYGMSTIVAHTHMLNLMCTMKGNVATYYIDGGHCCRPEIMEYYQEKTTTFSPWVAGFIVMINNCPEIIAPYRKGPKERIVERREFY